MQAGPGLVAGTVVPRAGVAAATGGRHRSSPIGAFAKRTPQNELLLAWRTPRSRPPPGSGKIGGVVAGCVVVASAIVRRCRA
eukprot:4615219-Prymnesium_polylepis.1